MGTSKQWMSGVIRLRRAAVIAAIAAAGLATAAAPEPASAHARCDGAYHRDFHTARLHYDGHHYSGTTYRQHYHWWSGQYHVHPIVHFSNDRHADRSYRADCG